jgi:hypothetical protein
VRQEVIGIKALTRIFEEIHEIAATKWRSTSWGEFMMSKCSGTEERVNFEGLEKCQSSKDAMTDGLRDLLWCLWGSMVRRQREAAGDGKREVVAMKSEEMAGRDQRSGGLQKSNWDAKGIACWSIGRLGRN